MDSRKKIITILCLFFTFIIPSLAEDIHEAVKTGDIERLKKILGENPSLVNSPDKDKMIPLHHAIDTGNLEVVSLLISHGADVNAVNYKKETPLYIAVLKGDAAAEGFAYTLKHFKKATIVGETTRRMAHPSKEIVINKLFRISVPFRRSENAITKTN